MPSKNPVLTGYFSRAGHPAIKIGVYGIHAGLKQEFEAIIDTGFTGFHLMPTWKRSDPPLQKRGTQKMAAIEARDTAKPALPAPNDCHLTFRVGGYSSPLNALSRMAGSRASSSVFACAPKSPAVRTFSQSASNRR